jgi:hypothetical protein
MCNVSKPVNGRLVLDHFDYRGVHGCPSHCALELIPLSSSRIAAIATELRDNPGHEHHQCRRVFGLARVRPVPHRSR